MVKTSTGLEENVAGLLSYLLGWLTGLLFVLLEKENKFVRFHAFQSLATFLGLTVLSWILSALGGVFGWLSGLLGLVGLILWIVLMYKAYKGEKYKLPAVGDWAEKQA